MGRVSRRWVWVESMSVEQHPYFLFIFCNVISFLFYNNYIVKFGPLNRPGAHFACNNYLLPTAISACEQLQSMVL